MTTRGDRGLSLAEALVASLLVGLVLVAAGAMLSQIGRTAEREAGRSPGVGGRTDVALDRLERDLVLAESVRARGSGRAGAREIVLDLGTGGTIAWRQEGSRLVRSVDASAAESGEAAGHGASRAPRETTMLDALLVVDLRRRSSRLFDVTLRRRDEPLRRRTVLLRNLGADEAGDEP